MPTRPADSLARPLALAYALLVAYACLHPLAGWRDSGLPPFDWLWAPWPKYFILEDFIFNIVGYLPLGLLIAAACFVWEYRQTRNRKPMACFNAFLHNHWAGLAIFLGIVADYAIR